MYREQLKCDAVQVSHHGWGSASEEFFNLLSPKILLWNNSEFGFRYADKYQGYGKTKSSTDLYNMPCVKSNYFCNTIKMQYVDLHLWLVGDILLNKKNQIILVTKNIENINTKFIKIGKIENAEKFVNDILQLEKIEINLTNLEEKLS